MNITKLSIVGYWELVKFEAIADDGDVLYPFGQNVRGLLHYAVNKIFSVALQLVPFDMKLVFVLIVAAAQQQLL